MATDLASVSTGGAVGVGHAIAAGRGDWSDWANTLAVMLPGGARVATAADAVTRPFRSADLDGDGIPDAPQALTAVKGVGDAIAGAAGAVGGAAASRFKPKKLRRHTVGADQPQIEDTPTGASSRQPDCCAVRHVESHSDERSPLKTVLRRRTSSTLEVHEGSKLFATASKAIAVDFPPNEDLDR